MRKLTDLVKPIEEKINSESEFKEYANRVLKQAHGDDFDEKKAKETIDGILDKVKGNFGKAIGMLTSSLGESKVEAIEESTRWQIGKIDKNGKITSTYVHSAGQPTYVIPKLKYYSKKSDVDNLLKLGKSGISFVGKKIGAKNDFANPDYDVCMFYGRDRDEKGNAITTGSKDKFDQYLGDVANDGSAEFVYLFDETDGKWYYSPASYSGAQLMPVKEMVNNETPAHEIVENYLRDKEVENLEDLNEDQLDELEKLLSANENLDQTENLDLINERMSEDSISKISEPKFKHFKEFMNQHRSNKVNESYGQLEHKFTFAMGGDMKKSKFEELLTKVLLDGDDKSLEDLRNEIDDIY